MQSSRRSRCPAILFIPGLLISLTTSNLAKATPSSFTLFESGQVRPLALSPDGKRLFAVNTPDNRIEIYLVKSSGLVHQASVPVGLEPVAIAARSNAEVWVVNHLSDSVSVVELDPIGSGGRVVRTLLVGDEPRDIVFAGPGRGRAFITAAHRGQNIPFDPQLTTGGVGRADVWVFNASNLGASLGGDPLTIVTLFTDTPRALAVTNDGTRVYAAGFHTGNRTATVFQSQVTAGFGPRGVPGPSTNAEGEQAPEVGLIVKFNGSHWVDVVGRTWDDSVRFSLPDKDVFAIDAMANPPEQVAGPAGFFTGVGTILYNMAVNPVSGKVYVSNTEANNNDRFEGPGTFTGHSLRGHLHESRITVLSGAGVAPRHLNKHIDYNACCAPVPNAENDRSLATPTGMAVSPNGATLYVAALGSNKVGVYSTAALENDTFVPSTANQIGLSGGAPSGLVLDDARHRLYVLTRLDDGISIVDTVTRSEIGHVKMHTPEPASIVSGRKYLYDASFSSSHGDAACSSCHVFGDLDSLAWDLGNPDNPVIPDPGPFNGSLFNPFIGADMPQTFHPMKGPMTTQSLRGMANHGPMHWRGDRTGGNAAPSVQPDSGSFDERAAFKAFQVGFPDLLGRSGPIPDDDMEEFADFALQITYPPNPIRNLDSSFTPFQQAGHDFFFRPIRVDITNSCIGCHPIDPNANPSSQNPGFFGASGLSSFDLVPQLLKIPHLRNTYQKIGMFGFPESVGITPGDNGFKGDQIRGFGFVHDGSVDTPFRFHSANGFSNTFPDNPNGIPETPAGDEIRRQLEAFIFAFDSNMAPIVGQQITLTPSNGAVAGPRIDLLRSRADVGECDLVAKTRLFFEEIGFLYIGGGNFITDRGAFPPIADASLRAFAASLGRPLTYTCAPPGSGERIGVDRDGDGFLDGDERDACTDPADPASTP